MSERTDGTTASSASEKPLKRKHKEDVDEETVVHDVIAKEVKKPPMPTYGKYNILKVLKENHCLIADEEEQLGHVFPRNKRYDLDDIKQFINKSARKSQSITEKNTKSTDFKRANDLIKTIEERLPFTEKSLDVPLSLKTITDVFNYEEEEVDVRMLYQTLTNLSLGFPTSVMDNATSEFLYGVYKEFNEQVNTPEFQEDIRRYKDFFGDKRNLSDDRADVKHPTEGSDMQLVIKSTINCPSINPLNVPFALVHKPKDSF